MNIEEILSYKRPTENYYDILGCDQSSSIEQINKEYRIKALQLHPDKNSDPETLERFRRIQAAKEVLSDESSRRSYDSWLNSRIHIPFEQWRNKKNHSMHWSSPKTSKLSIQQGSSIGQGSDFNLIGAVNKDYDKRWLEKFRNYEI